MLVKKISKCITILNMSMSNIDIMENEEFNSNNTTDIVYLLNKLYKCIEILTNRNDNNNSMNYLCLTIVKVLTLQREDEMYINKSEYKSRR